MSTLPLPTIADIIRTPGPFSGTFRFCRTAFHPTRAGWKFSRAEITDSTGCLTCNGWPSQFFPIPDLPPMTVVQVTGRTRVFNNGVVADAATFIPAGQMLTASTSLQLLPMAHCPVPALIPRLVAVIGTIVSANLRAFVGDVFASDRIALPFLRVPASIGYHHVEPGGHLMHIVEGAEFLAAIPGLSAEERDIGLTGYLFHDVGKTVTYTETDYTKAGLLMSHDALTMELCAPALATLDQTWPDAALTLRHVWTCESPGSRYGFKSASIIAELVRFADRLSAERDKQRRAFQHAPADESVRVTRGQRYWRPKAEQV